MGTAYLCHHGIKGQKWGVRRYQNEDGSLTADGRARYLTSNGGLTRKGRAFLESEAKKKTYNDYWGNMTRRKARVAEELKAKGMTDLDDNTMLLKKGSIVNRIAGDEGIDSRRKYVSITDDDKVYYDEDYYWLPIKGTPNQYEYELTKDAKVASYNNVINHVIENYGHLTLSQLNIGEHELGHVGNKQAVDRMMQQVKDMYGDTPVKELYKDYYLTQRIRSQVPTINPKTHEWIEAPSPRWLKDRANISHEALKLLLNKTLMNKSTSDKVFDKYKADGYDLIVDVEDKISGFDMPMIVLDPSKTLKLKKKTPLKHEDTDMNIYYESSVTDPGLEHHGIKGMKWGIRRFQNPDGSLTEAGKRRYGTVEGLRAAYDDKLRRKTTRLRRKAESTTDTAKAAKYSTDADDLEKEYKNWMEDRKNSQETKKKIAEEKEKAKSDHEAEVKAKDAKEVADAVATGDPEKISEVMDKMTTQEIKDAINRIDTMKSLRDKIEPGLMKKGINVVSTAFKARAAEAVTEKIMKLGKDPDDLSGLSKEERDRMKRLKELTEATLGVVGGGSKAGKDYSNALAKAASENEAKEVAKYVKDLEKNGVSHETAVQMGQKLMNQRMSSYESSSGSGNDGGNQNGGKSEESYLSKLMSGNKDKAVLEAYKDAKDAGKSETEALRSAREKEMEFDSALNPSPAPTQESKSGKKSGGLFGKGKKETDDSDSGSSSSESSKPSSGSLAAKIASLNSRTSDVLSTPVSDFERYYSASPSDGSLKSKVNSLNSRIMDMSMSDFERYYKK